MFDVKRSRQDVSDLVLVDRVRDGDSAAFDGLWERHQDAGLRAARQISNRFDPEDLVQEAFTRVLSAIRGGKGPRDAFRPYLYAAIRTVSMNWTRDGAKEHTLEDLSSQVDVDAMFEDVLLEQTVTGQAFKSLRPEWRTILWYTAVEGMSAKEAGPMLGLSANAAAALAYRAREGLRVAWLQAHVRSVDADPACAWTVDRIGAYQRSGLRRKDAAAFEDHLSGCAKCTLLVRETTDLATSLKGILLPIVLGAGIVSLEATEVGLLGGALIGGSAVGGSTLGGSTAGGSAAGGSAMGSSGAAVTTGVAASGGAGVMGGATVAAAVATAALVAAAAVAISVGSTTDRAPSPSADESVMVADVEETLGPEVPGRIREREREEAVPAVPPPTELSAEPTAPAPDDEQPQPEAAPTEEPSAPASEPAPRADTPADTPAEPPVQATPDAPSSVPAEPSSPAPQPQTTSPEPTAKPTEPDSPPLSPEPGPGIMLTLPGGSLSIDLPGRGNAYGHDHGHGHKYGHSKGNVGKNKGGRHH